MVMILMMGMIRIMMIVIMLVVRSWRRAAVGIIVAIVTSTGGVSIGVRRNFRLMWWMR